MKRLILLFLLSIFIQNASAQDQKQIETIQSNTAVLQGNKVQRLQNQITASTIKTDSLPETKKSIWLGSKVHVEPIYIIDGVPLNEDNFKQLNPDDIVSISILKDEKDTFMCRSTNGVIIVKTKNGLTRKEKRKLKREKKKLEK